MVWNTLEASSLSEKTLVAEGERDCATAIVADGVANTTASKLAIVVRMVHLPFAIGFTIGAKAP